MLLSLLLSEVYLVFGQIDIIPRDISNRIARTLPLYPESHPLSAQLRHQSARSPLQPLADRYDSAITYTSPPRLRNCTYVYEPPLRTTNLKTASLKKRTTDKYKIGGKLRGKSRTIQGCRDYMRAGVRNQNHRRDGVRTIIHTREKDVCNGP